MNKMKFSPLHLSHLSNEDAGAIIKLTCDIAIPVKTLLGEMPLAALTLMITNTNPFFAQINRMRKSELTGQVNVKNKTSDEIFSEIKRTVVFQLKSRDLIKKAAARKLEFFFGPFWEISKQPIATQYERSKEMFAKYIANAEVTEAATIIGITTQLSELETENNSLGEVYLERNVEVSGRQESGSNLRQPASESYQIFCNVIEMAVNLIPNSTFLNLFNNMDELRKKFHALLPLNEITIDEEIGETDPEV